MHIQKHYQILKYKIHKCCPILKHANTYKFFGKIKTHISINL